jgi:uncharacterized FAD-dependent dehydrogenase
MEQTKQSTNMDKRIVIVGGGVAGMYAATKLIDRKYSGNCITIIDAGKDPHNRLPEEVMHGGFGAGLFSDGKWVYLHNTIGGQLAKYTGEEKADQLIDESWQYILRFHPEPDKVMFSNPVDEPEFIKPYFNLRMAPTYHIGTNYLHDMGKRWYDWLVEQGVNFVWETKVNDIDFNSQEVWIDDDQSITGISSIRYDKLIYGTGKSGIDLTQQLINKYNLRKEPKSVQIGVRMELPQKYMQPIVDISYDFKLYQKPNERVSLRTFCSNNNAAYVAEEETYGMKSYNGHSFKQDDMINNITNFGIIMEIKGIDNPFEFQKKLVGKCQDGKNGLYYSPGNYRKPSSNAEGHDMNITQIDWMGLLNVSDAFEGYFEYIVDFIHDLNQVFQFGNDYGIYIPEVKFLSEEVLVNYDNLSLIDYPNVHFVGDSLSSRGIAVSAAHGVLVGSAI